MLDGDDEVGVVTSGTFSPTLQKSLCMAYLDADVARADAESFEVAVRTSRIEARRVDLPFYPSRAASSKPQDQRPCALERESAKCENLHDLNS